MTYTTIAIIFNPNSTGSSGSMARELADELGERLPDQSVQLIATEYAGHAKTLAYEIACASKRPLIISSSGDGGYHEVVNGAMKAAREGHRPVTGLLPAGNANDHYRNLHDGNLIDRIAGGKTMRVDLLKLSAVSDGEPIERYAHSYIGFSLTPKVGRLLNKTKLNVWTEFWVVASALLSMKPTRLIISKKARRYDSVIFSNIDTMSKYLKISQPSSVTDGKFEVTIFPHRSKLRLLLTLFWASLARLEEDVQVAEFSLQTVGETLVQADGEIIKLDADSNVRIMIEKCVLESVV